MGISLNWFNKSKVMGDTHLRLLEVILGCKGRVHLRLGWPRGGWAETQIIVTSFEIKASQAVHSLIFRTNQFLGGWGQFELSFLSSSSERFPNLKIPWMEFLTLGKSRPVRRKAEPSGKEVWNPPLKPTCFGQKVSFSDSTCTCYSIRLGVGGRQGPRG